jgi:hypothetical protein
VPASPPKPPLRPGLAAARIPAKEDPLLKSKREREELEANLVRLEEALEELKARYEMYFLGTERREPNRDRDELKKRILRVKDAFTRNAALRFRIQSLHARYLSYERLWLRSAREKEEGTYRRDLFKARLHAKQVPAPEPLSPATVPGTPVSAAPPPPLSATARPGAAPSPEATPRPGAPAAPPPPAAVPRLGETELRELYDAYVSARRRCNEDVSRLTYDALAKTVSKQIPELMAKHKAKSIEFRVVIKDGKAVLKAIPKS